MTDKEKNSNELAYKLGTAGVIYTYSAVSTFHICSNVLRRTKANGISKCSVENIFVSRLIHIILKQQRCLKMVAIIQTRLPWIPFTIICSFGLILFN